MSDANYEWLGLQVCTANLWQKCSSTPENCLLAHHDYGPNKNIPVTGLKVYCCMSSIQEKPCIHMNIYGNCKYYHPPPHLKSDVKRQGFIQKKIFWHEIPICPGFLKGNCLTPDGLCQLAHPVLQTKRLGTEVVCCTNFLKTRECKFFIEHGYCMYYHPPEHLLDKVYNGRKKLDENNALRNYLLAQNFQYIQKNPPPFIPSSVFVPSPFVQPAYIIREKEPKNALDVKTLKNSSPQDWFSVVEFDTSTTIFEPEETFDEDMIFKIFVELATKNSEKKATVIHPNFASQFASHSWNQDEEDLIPAREFAHPLKEDFSIILIPMHSKNPNIWTLGIFSINFEDGECENIFVVDKNPQQAWHEIAMQRAIQTIFGKENKLENVDLSDFFESFPPKMHDFESGARICLYAENYLKNGFLLERKDLDEMDIEFERKRFFEMIEKSISMVDEKEEIARYDTSASLNETIDIEKFKIEEFMDEDCVILDDIKVKSLTLKKEMPSEEHPIQPNSLLRLSISIGEQISTENKQSSKKIFAKRSALKKKIFRLIRKKSRLIKRKIGKNKSEEKMQWKPEFLTSTTLKHPSHNFVFSRSIINIKKEKIQFQCQDCLKVQENFLFSKNRHEKTIKQERIGTIDYKVRKNMAIGNPRKPKNRPHLCTNAKYSSLLCSTEIMDTQKGIKNGPTSTGTISTSCASCAKNTKNCEPKIGGLSIKKEIFEAEANESSQTVAVTKKVVKKSIRRYKPIFISKTRLKIPGFDYIFFQRQISSAVYYICLKCNNLRARIGKTSKDLLQNIPTNGLLKYDEEKELIVGDPENPNGKPHLCKNNYNFYVNGTGTSKSIEKVMSGQRKRKNTEDLSFENASAPNNQAKKLRTDTVSIKGLSQDIVLHSEKHANPTQSLDQIQNLQNKEASLICENSKIEQQPGQIQIKTPTNQTDSISTANFMLNIINEISEKMPKAQENDEVLVDSNNPKQILIVKSNRRTKNEYTEELPTTICQEIPMRIV